MAVIPGRTVIILLGVFLLLIAWSPVSAREWLPDGGFEPGPTGWDMPGASPAHCTPHTGSGALGVDAEDIAVVQISRMLESMPAGTYTLSGWAMLQSGTGTLDVSLIASSTAGPDVPRSIGIGPEYRPFSFDFDFSIATSTTTVLFEFRSDGFAVLCLDDLSLTSEDLPTPTSTATQTPTPAPTSTPTSSPPPSATAIPPTVTSVPPSPTATSANTPTPSPTVSATPQATSSPSPTPEPAFVFVNGGFEDGLAGWQKYGGTLSTTSNASSGSTAGLLISDTESTKWAYQAVRVAPSQWYEFSANVQPDGGVSEAYLRISWYASDDASGAALSSSDSLQRTGPGPYAFLTTGAVQAPPEAGSARVRIVMAPSSATTATVSIDDAAFFATAAATPTPVAPPTETPVPTASAAPSATATVAMLGAVASATMVPSDETPEPANGIESQALAAPASPGTSTPEAYATAFPERFQQVAAARSEARASTSSSASSSSLPSASPAALVLSQEQEDAGGVSLPWVVGAVLLLGGLTGVYWQNRRAGG